MLRYRPLARYDEGPKIFDGHPSDFKLWEFHTEIKAELAASEESKAAKYVSEVMKTLSGEALQLARDMGVKELCKKDGIKELISKMKTLVFPTLKQEASQLYQIGHEKGGDLARQVNKNEPMTSYIERRTLWWKLMQEYDPAVKISDDIRGHQLLENSGLTKDQQNMILVSTQNSLGFDKVKEALIAQHGVTHMSSHNYHARLTHGDRHGRSHQSWKGRGKRHSAGYIAESYDDGQDQGYYGEEEYYDQDYLTSYPQEDQYEGYPAYEDDSVHYDQDYDYDDD